MSFSMKTESRGDAIASEIAVLESIGFVRVFAHPGDQSVQARHLVKMVMTSPEKRDLQKDADSYAGRSNSIKKLNVIYSCACGRIKFGQKHKAVQHVLAKHSDIPPQQKQQQQKINLDADLVVCTNCRVSDRKLLSCGGCTNNTVYCSVECQRLDWNKHQVECRRNAIPIAPAPVPAANEEESDTEAGPVTIKDKPTQRINIYSHTPTFESKNRFVERVAKLTAEVQGLKQQAVFQEAELVRLRQQQQQHPAAAATMDSDLAKRLEEWEKAFGTVNPFEALRLQSERISKSAFDARLDLSRDIQRRLHGAFTMMPSPPPKRSLDADPNEEPASKRQNQK